MIAFYNPVWSYYVHHSYNHPYIYDFPYSPYLYYESHPTQLAHPAQQGLIVNKQPKDFADLLDVFIANNLGNLTTLRYPPYSSRRFRYYRDF